MFASTNKHNLFITIAFKLLLSLQTYACHAATQEAHSSNLFNIHGSNTLGTKLVPLWVKKYLASQGVQHISMKPALDANTFRILGMLDNAPIFVDISAHGSSTGFKHLLKDPHTIAMSSRKINKQEAGEFLHFSTPDTQKENRPIEHVVGMDGLAIIVNNINSIQSLTLQQVTQIFSGQITSWAELGGPDLNITIHSRDTSSGTWKIFQRSILSEDGALVRTAKRFESNAGVSEAVARTPGAIGFTPLAFVGKNRALALTQNDGVNIYPKRLEVATEDYPISRRLFLYARPKHNNAHIEQFLDFVHSDEGQSLVDTAGFISQNIQVYPAAKNLQGPAGYSQLTLKSKRLSVNFRFHSNSATLDHKAQQDIKRLARFLKTQSPSDHHIQLVGFGDQKQSESRSILLSKLRAAAVKRALFKEGVKCESVMGFGSQLPVVANHQHSTFVNQRVEVWIYHHKHHLSVNHLKKNLGKSFDSGSNTHYASSL